MHNMILQYDGLDIIGNNDEDYGTEEDHEDNEDDFEMGDDPHMEGVEVVDDETVAYNEMEPEVEVGYADKKSRLWVHYKCASDRGELRWLNRASVCRPTNNRDPLGALGPWKVNDEAVV